MPLAARNLSAVCADGAFHRRRNGKLGLELSKTRGSFQQGFLATDLEVTYGLIGPSRMFEYPVLKISMHAVFLRIGVNPRMSPIRFLLLAVTCVSCGGPPPDVPTSTVNPPVDKPDISSTQPLQPPSGAIVAIAFNYPHPDRVKESHDAPSAERNAVWSRTYASNDHTFAPTTVTLFPAGEYLTSERVKELSSYAAEMRMEDAQDATESDVPGMAESIAHEFDLSGGRKGFAFIEGFGAGGAGYKAAAPSLDERYELVVAVSWAHDEADDPMWNTDATKDYAERLSAGANRLLEDVVRQLDTALFK